MVAGKLDRRELNRFAIKLVKERFITKGYRIEDVPSTTVDFIAISNDGSRMKLKIRSISQIGSYIFSTKKKFNINDEELYMMVVYVPINKEERTMYLIPATEWGKEIYPFKGNDYKSPKLKSEPEWGISFSRKAKTAMESYKF